MRAWRSIDENLCGCVKVHSERIFVAGFGRCTNFTSVESKNAARESLKASAKGEGGGGYTRGPGGEDQPGHVSRQALRATRPSHGTTRHGKSARRAAQHESSRKCVMCPRRSDTSRNYVDMSEKVGHITYPGQRSAQIAAVASSGWSPNPPHTPHAAAPVIFGSLLTPHTAEGLIKLGSHAGAPTRGTAR